MALSDNSVLPRIPPFINGVYTKPDGTLTTEAYLFNDQTFQSLRSVVDGYTDGIAVAPRTTAEITLLEPNAPVGALWFNTSLAKLQVKTAAGVVETITST